MTRSLVLLSLLFLVGCDDSRADDDGGARMDAGARADGSVQGNDGGATGNDGGATGDDGGALGNDGGGVDAGGGGPALSICVIGCVTPADCDSGSPAFDANNYRCDGRACEYTGCVDDAECQGTFANPGYGCRDLGGGVRTCVETCTTAADCGSGTPAFDTDNYTCDAGVCVYQGCRDDTECTGTFGSAYGCFDMDPPPLPIPIPVATRNCVRRCASAAECETDRGAFSADNYRCEAGACRYQGCLTDMECDVSLAGARSYVCD